MVIEIGPQLSNIIEWIIALLFVIAVLKIK